MSCGEIAPADMETLCDLVSNGACVALLAASHDVHWGGTWVAKLPPLLLVPHLSTSGYLSGEIHCGSPSTPI